MAVVVRWIVIGPEASLTISFLGAVTSASALIAWIEALSYADGVDKKEVKE